MTVAVYGREKCGKCQSAKEKIEIMGFEYTTHNLDYHIQWHEGWRDDNAVDLLAYCALKSTDHIPLPVVEINGEFYQYAEAMRVLKQHKKSA